MTHDIALTLCVLVATVALFLSDRLRLDVVALLSALSLSLLGLASPEVMLSGFANNAVVMIAGLFVVGAGLSETGLADWLGRRLEPLAGDSPRRVLAVVVCASASLSAVMSSTGTVALLTPMVVGIAARRRIAPRLLLMPLAFGAHLGSNLTLISTPPNLIVSDALRRAGHAPFRFFSFTGPGLVVLALGVTYLALVCRRLLHDPHDDTTAPSTLSTHDLASAYGLVDALTTLHVAPECGLVGRSLADTNLRAAYGVTVVSVERDGDAQRVLPRLVFAAHDVLRVLGSAEAVETLCAREGTVLHHREAEFVLPPEESLAELMLPRRSPLVGRSLRDLRFRDRYRATVLAAKRVEGERSQRFANTALRDLTLRSGDMLLVKGRRKYLRHLRDAQDALLLVAEPDHLPGVLLDRPRAFGALAITLAMLLVMAFGWLPNVVAVLCAALLLVLGGAVRPASAYRAINWESVVLIACMIPLSTTLESSGATSLLVSRAETALHGVAPLGVMALLVAATSALGMVLSNTATAVLVAPVAVRLGEALGIAPEPLLVGVAFASSAAFATPIASPVNVLVMPLGRYRFGDYVRVGLPLQVLVLAATVLLVPLVWPLRTRAARSQPPDGAPSSARSAGSAAGGTSHIVGHTRTSPGSAAKATSAHASCAGSRGCPSA